MSVVNSLFDQYRSLRLLREPRLALLAVAKFLDTMSTTIIVPLLPTYANQLGANALLIGVIFAAPEVAKSILNIPFGHISDRTGRRSWIVIGMLLGAISVILLGFVGAPLALVVLRMLDGVGAAMKMPATSAYIGDITSEDERASAFSAYQTLGMLALAVGPVVGGALSAIGGLSTPFIVLGSGTLASGMLLFVYLPSASTTDKTDASEEEPSFWDVSLADFTSLLSVPVLTLLFIGLASVFGTTAFTAFLALLLERSYATSPAFAGIAWSAFGLALFLFIPIGGTAADQIGRKPLLILGQLGWVVAAIGLAVLTEQFAAIGLLFLGGIASASVGPAWSSLIYEIAPDDKKGTLTGISGSVSAIGGALGPTTGGIIVQQFGVQFLFVTIGLSWFLATVGLTIFVPETGTISEDDPSEAGASDGL